MVSIWSNLYQNHVLAIIDAKYPATPEAIPSLLICFSLRKNGKGLNLALTHTGLELTTMGQAGFKLKTLLTQPGIGGMSDEIVLLYSRFLKDF